MTAVDVFVGNYTLIDSELYGLWLNGYSGEFMLLFLDFKFKYTHMDVEYPSVMGFR